MPIWNTCLVPQLLPLAAAVFSAPVLAHTSFPDMISVNQEQCKSFTNTVASPSGSSGSSCSPQHACIGPCSLGTGFGSPEAELTFVVSILQQNRKTWALWKRENSRRKKSLHSLLLEIHPKVADACFAVYSTSLQCSIYYRIIMRKKKVCILLYSLDLMQCLINNMHPYFCVYKIISPILIFAFYSLFFPHL